MKVCICDDIPEYRIAIRSYVEQYCKEKDIRFCMDEFDSPEALLSTENVNEYDVFFLDIEYGQQTNGIELIHRLQSLCDNSFYIVVTAYRQYLDDAMDLNVLRFIDKPISQDRVFFALDKAIDVIYHSIVTFDCVDGNQYRINKKDLIFAEANMRKSKIVTTKGTFICRETFKNLKSTLVSSVFLVPHSSFLINKNYISMVGRRDVYLTYRGEKYIIPISSAKQREFREKFNR